MPTNADPRAIAGHLLAARTRDAAKEIVAGLRARELHAVADVLGITIRGTVARKREYLVEYVGRGLDSRAIERVVRNY